MPSPFSLAAIQELLSLLSLQALCEFHSLSSLGGASGYALIYDCTFLCAIAPAHRRRWAATVAELLRPGGALVMDIFPVRPGAEDYDGAGSLSYLSGAPDAGPPYQLGLELVRVLCSGAGLELVSLEPVAAG